MQVLLDELGANSPVIGNLSVPQRQQLLAILQAQANYRRISMFEMLETSFRLSKQVIKSCFQAIKQAQAEGAHAEGAQAEGAQAEASTN